MVSLPPSPPRTGGPSYWSIFSEGALVTVVFTSTLGLAGGAFPAFTRGGASNLIVNRTRTHAMQCRIVVVR